MIRNDIFDIWSEAKNYIPHIDRRKKVPLCEMHEPAGSLSCPMPLIL